MLGGSPKCPRKFPTDPVFCYEVDGIPSGEIGQILSQMVHTHIIVTSAGNRFGRLLLDYSSSLLEVLIHCRT
jgi:hypothetical protein